MRKTEKELNSDLAGTLAMSRLCGWYFGYSRAMWPVLELQWMMVDGTGATMGG